MIYALIAHLFTALREFDLKSGDEKRLRFIDPLSRACAFSLMADKKSRWYINPTVRNQVYFCSGGILRWLTTAATKLKDIASSRGGKTKKGDTEIVEDLVFDSMLSNCMKFFERLSPKKLDDAVNMFSLLIIGKAKARLYKPLYDCGVVARAESTMIGLDKVEFVSPMAAAAAQRAFAACSPGKSRPKSSFRIASEWGSELERRVLACFGPFDKLVSTVTIDGQAAAALHIKVDYTLPFEYVGQSKEFKFHSVLFAPVDPSFPVDAIIVPRLGGKKNEVKEPIYVIEVSTTSPRDTDRANKCISWFAKDGIIDQLQKAHVGHSIVVLLCYDGQFSMINVIEKVPQYKTLENMALSKGIIIRVLEVTLLEGLGVYIENRSLTQT